MDPDTVVGWTSDEGLFGDDHREEDGKRPIRFQELDPAIQQRLIAAEKMAEALDPCPKCNWTSRPRSGRPDPSRHTCPIGLLLREYDEATQ